MQNVITGGIALLLTTTSAFAVGLDRSNQNIGIIFEDGDYAELSFGNVSPSITGADLAAGGNGTGNVGGDFNQISLGYKTDINEQFSIALIFDEPYGADIEYPVGSSVLLGGTAAELNSSAITALGRYKIDNNFSVHAGIRAETIDAEITLAGAAFAQVGLDGYNVVLEEETEFGYSIGGAYERPEIALRVALTYHSAIDYEFDTLELGAPSLPTAVTTPEAINLDFQTGIAADTLLFGQIRWAKYEDVIVAPAGFVAGGGQSLTDIDTGVSYSLGVGRRFNDAFSGSISIGFDSEGDDDLVSPLSPTNGNRSIALGGEYKVDDNITIGGGIRYVQLGDAFAAPGGTPASRFTDNDVVAFGIRVGYSF